MQLLGRDLQKNNQLRSGIRVVNALPAVIIFIRAYLHKDHYVSVFQVMGISTVCEA